MPFKTGKGTAGGEAGQPRFRYIEWHENIVRTEHLFQCPLRRARVLRGGKRGEKECFAKFDVSMPFKTGKGTAGQRRHHPGFRRVMFQCPLRRARVLRVLCKDVVFAVNGVSMPFKTGKGTAGQTSRPLLRGRKKFQCPLRRARVLRDRSNESNARAVVVVSMPFKTGKGTAGRRSIMTAHIETLFQCPLRRARVLRAVGCWCWRVSVWIGFNAL